MHNRKVHTNRGFTLIEMLVGIALFTFIAVTAIGAMIAIVDGNKKTRAQVDAMSELSFALESMTREIRVGNQFDCYPGGGDCDLGAGGGTEFRFQSSENTLMVYRLNGTRLERCGTVNGDCPNPSLASNYVAMTGGNITINTMRFYVQGSSPADDEQPRVTIYVDGTAGPDPNAGSDFTVQTTVTQRFPDF